MWTIAYSTHSGQVDVGNNDLVESRRSILARLAGVTAGVVLVLGITASLPGLRVGSDANGVLGRGRSGVTRKVPASETESTGHDGEQDLCLSKQCQSSGTCCRLVGLQAVTSRGGFEAGIGLCNLFAKFFLGISKGEEASSTYVELGVLAGALLESVLVGFAAGGRGSVFGARVDARGTERAGCAESGASDD